jgi:hypothetical protein
MTFAEHVYDFYKPDMLSEYPRVDGQLSNDCYFRSLDSCYGTFANKSGEQLKNFDYTILHSPYNKVGSITHAAPDHHFIAFALVFVTKHELTPFLSLLVLFTQQVGVQVFRAHEARYQSQNHALFLRSSPSWCPSVLRA